MKKFFISGLILGFCGLGMIRLFSYTGKERILYENELPEVKGYKELNDEERGRVEELKGRFKIGEMQIFESGFDMDGYKTYDDEIVGLDLVFEGGGSVVLGGEHHQAVSIDLDDADYFWGLRYINPSRYFGEKSVVTIWFYSLDNRRNAFSLFLSANGNIFFQPGELSDYGNDPYNFYTMWGAYEVVSCEEEVYESEKK